MIPVSGRCDRPASEIWIRGSSDPAETSGGPANGASTAPPMPVKSILR